MANFSNHIVYVDESGDHGLETIDPHYPMFVLAFCLFRKDEYAEVVTTAVTKLKFKHFGHDLVIFHERDIRKANPPFRSLVTNPQTRDPFFDDLTTLVRDAPFTLIATAIRKHDLTERYAIPDNPYKLALAFGLERLTMCLRERRDREWTTHVVVESRGKKEDEQLELQFRRVCDGNNYLNERLPFEIVFADKLANSSGLQLADLLARPIGRKLLNPAQENRAYDTLEPKFRRSWSGRLEGYGLKVFP